MYTGIELEILKLDWPTEDATCSVTINECIDVKQSGKSRTLSFNPGYNEEEEDQDIQAEV